MYKFNWNIKSVFYWFMIVIFPPLSVHVMIVDNVFRCNIALNSSVSIMHWDLSYCYHIFVG